MPRSRKNKKESSPFSIASVSPDGLTSEQFIQEFDTAIAALQKLEMQQRGKRVVELRVNHSDPIQLILAGDLHLGSFATNKEMIDQLRDYLLSTPNAVLVLMGDEIEGFKAQYASTNVLTTIPGLQTQLDYFYNSFFKPLAAAGKIAGVVSGYWGHNGWAHDDTTINIWAAMTRHHSGVPLIANGGRLKVRFRNGKTTEVQVHHNPPGKSQVDPVHGLRKAAQIQNPANRPEIVGGAHTHRAMVVTEWYPGVNKQTDLVQAGTPKSSTPGGNTDPFGEKLGLGLADPWLQGVVIKPPKGRRGTKKYQPEVRLPFISYQQGLVVQAALELLNQTEKTGTTAEILEQIHEKFPKPKVTYVPARSRVTESPAERVDVLNKRLKTKNGEDRLTAKDIAPLYEGLSYDIQTHLPIVVHAVANARLGSYHEQQANLPIEEYLNQLAQDQYAFVVFLRNIMDKDSGKDPSRLEILQRYIDMVDVMDGRVLGVMLDGNLGSKAWLKRLGELCDLKPISAGSYLSLKTHAKLIHHMSTISLAVGPEGGFVDKTFYLMQTVDRLLRHGSFSSTKGIKRIYDLYAADRPSVMMGGHMPVAGTGQFYDRTNLYTQTPVLLSPGWWAQFVDTTGTRSKGGKPGQAVILMPGTNQSDAMVIPTSSEEQTREVSRAVTLWAGVQLLNLAQQI